MNNRIMSVLSFSLLFLTVISACSIQIYSKHGDINTGIGATVVGIRQGGTGTSSVPTFGDVLMGNGSGVYVVVPTSSLGITGGFGSEVDPIWSAVSTSLNVNNFASPNISQWTNDSGYVTTGGNADSVLVSVGQAGHSIEKNVYVAISSGEGTDSQTIQTVSTSANYAYITNQNFVSVVIKPSDFSDFTCPAESVWKIFLTSGIQYNTTTAYNLTFQIYNTDESHFPTGTPIYSSTTPGYTSAGVKSISFSDVGWYINKDSYYAFVFSASNTYGTAWGLKPVNPGLSEAYLSTDAGLNWSSTTTDRFAAGSFSTLSEQGKIYRYRTACTGYRYSFVGITDKAYSYGETVNIWSIGKIYGFSGKTPGHTCTKSTAGDLTCETAASTESDGIVINSSTIYWYPNNI